MIKNFTEIQSWQIARELNKKIYKLTNNTAFSRDYWLKDQIRRASVSIMSNIAEWFWRKSNKEFIYFLSIARGSAYEVESQIYIAYDLLYITKEQFEELMNLLTSISKLLNKFITYLKTNQQPVNQ